MSSTIVVTRRYVCCSFCSLHKGETFCFQVQWVFRCKNPISSNQWVLFLEPFSRQWKSLRVSHPTLGSWGFFCPTHLRMVGVSAGGGGRKCSVNWPWKFSLAYAFGAPNVLVLLRGEQLKTQKANLKILLHENNVFFLFLCFWFFFWWLNPFLFEFYIFLAPFFFFLKTVHPGVLEFCWCGNCTEVVAIVVCIVTEFSQEGISCHDRWGCPTKQWGAGVWWMGSQDETWQFL